MSDVPQSLLEALDRTSRSLSERPLVSVMDVLEQWFASHHVIVLDECGPQCPAFEVAQPMAGIPARCFARYYLPGPDEAPIGKPCPVMTARAAREAANDTRGGVMSNNDDLKLFIWEGDGVLQDYTPGMIAVLAHDLGEALSLIREKADYAITCFPPDRYKVVTEPEAFLCWGGA